MSDNTNIDVNPVVRNINNMADSFSRAAKELEEIAKRTNRQGNYDGVEEAATVVTNCFMSLRLDLLVKHPIRELTRNSH